MRNYTKWIDIQTTLYTPKDTIVFLIRWSLKSKLDLLKFEGQPKRKRQILKKNLQGAFKNVFPSVPKDIF